MADSYTSLEHSLLPLYRRAVNLLFGPLLRRFEQIGLPPFVLSLAQLPAGALTILTVREHRGWTLALTGLALIFDALDGELARRTGQNGLWGTLVDQYCDHAREILLIAALADAGLLQPLWATLLALTTPGLNLALWLANHCNAGLPFAAKGAFTFYPTVLIYLLGGPNWMTPAAAAAVFAHVASIAWALSRIRGFICKIQPEA